MKKSNHTISMDINTSPEAAWHVIGAVKGVDQWLAPITDCRVEGTKRICTTAEGDFLEDILKIDHENRVFKYGIPSQHMVPVSNIVGQMSVSETQTGNAKVVWSWEFDVEEENETTAKETLSMVGGMGIQGIETLINQN